MIVNRVAPYQKQKSKMDFYAERRVMIDIAKDSDAVKADDVIRELVGKSSKAGTIERIYHCCTLDPRPMAQTHAYKKFSVQLTNNDMVDSVINNWSIENFGKYTMRKNHRRLQ